MISDPSNPADVKLQFDIYGFEFRSRHLAEMNRLYHLPDIWLGSTILKLARQAREDHPDICGSPFSQEGVSPIGFIFWAYIPEIARRLGAPRLMPIEINTGLDAHNNANLRERISASARAYNIFGIHAQKSMAMWTCLVMPHLGNPFVIGLDRLADPNEDDFFSYITRKETGKLKWEGDEKYEIPEIELGQSNNIIKI